MHCSHTVHGIHNHFIQKNIKNGSHDTIHTFRNYFATVFSSFSQISYIQTDQNIPFRARLVCNLSSLNFHYLIFISHHLKYLNFSNPLFGTLTQTQFSTSKVASGFHPTKKKKKSENLSNIAAWYVGLITKMLLKIKFWKLKTPKMCFQFS